jgi:hypothetical protein
MARPDNTKLEKAKYWGLLVLVFAAGTAFALPFGLAIFRLLSCSSPFCCTDAWMSHPYEMALRAAIAIAFAGIVLSILLLFYRMRNDDTAPSLMSGLLVVVVGAVLTAFIVFAMRGQLTSSAPAVSPGSSPAK